jgi:hypothetical protein
MCSLPENRRVPPETMITLTVCLFTVLVAGIWRRAKSAVGRKTKSAGFGLRTRSQALGDRAGPVSSNPVSGEPWRHMGFDDPQRLSGLPTRVVKWIA